MQPSTPEAPLAQEMIRRLLRKRIRCTLSDGRVVLGELQVLLSPRTYQKLLRKI
jgi:hypothetical protein